MVKTNVTYLEEKNYGQWNRFAAESPQGYPFCYSWWLETVTNNDFKILTVEEHGEIVAGFILPFYTTGQIKDPYLTRTSGVLYNRRGEETNIHRVSMERRWINALLKQIQIDTFVQLCFHPNFVDWLPLRWSGYYQTTKYTYIFDYKKEDMNTIKKNIGVNQKRNIKKAAKNKLRVLESDDADLAYEFSCLSFDRQHEKFPYSRRGIQKLDHAVKKNGKRKIFMVVDEHNTIHAVNYVVYDHKSAYHLLSGSDPRYRDKGGHTLLLWHTIDYFKDYVGIFDLGGSNIQPIEEHYRRFGGTQTPYFNIFNKAYVESALDVLSAEPHWNEAM